MDWRERIEEWAWVPGSIAILVAFNAFGVPLLAYFRVPAAWFAMAALLVILVVCCGGSARRDPVAFTSIAGPVLVLALVALALPWPANFALDALAFAFPVAFTCAGTVVWPIWWSLVLRRPSLPIWWDFDHRFATHAAEFRRSAERAMRDPPHRDRILRTAPKSIARLRRLSAPNAEWAALRDDVAAWEQALLDRIGRDEGVGDDMATLAAELSARYLNLRSAG